MLLEPTIGNHDHDQNFLDNWHLKLKQFWQSLTKDIFWNKIIDTTTTEIRALIEKQQKPKNNLKPFKVKLLSSC